MSRDPRHAPLPEEEDVVPSRLILEVFAGVVMVGVALCLVAYGVLGLREWQLRPSRRFPERELPPPHRVAELRQEAFDVVPPLPSSSTAAEERLHDYGWVDRSRGIVRIPIEQAMELVAAGVKP